MENFVRRFEYVVGKTPDKTALVCGDDRLTYRQLDELSSKIAARLIRNGAEKEKIYRSKAQQYVHRCDHRRAEIGCGVFAFVVSVPKGQGGVYQKGQRC